MPNAQKAFWPALHSPMVSMICLVGSPFPGCSDQGSSQKSRGLWAWHWSTAWSYFSRRNTCKGKHSLLQKWRTNSKNPCSLRGENMPNGEGQELLLKTHRHWLWTNLHFLWPSSTMSTVTPWDCRAWLPWDPSLFLTQKEEDIKYTPTSPEVPLSLVLTSGFQAAALRTGRFPWNTAAIHKGWLTRGCLLSGGLSGDKSWVTLVEYVDNQSPSDEWQFPWVFECLGWELTGDAPLPPPIQL